jgi:AraC-like DNA-binding protein
MGVYASPFTGLGMPFSPLVVNPEHDPFTLHETGYTARTYWNHPGIFSPYWRLVYDFKPGHKALFPDREILLGPGRIVLIPDHQLFHAMGEKPCPKFWLHFSCTRRVAPGRPVPVELAVQRIEMAVIAKLKELMTDKRREKLREQIRHTSMALLHLVLCRPEIHWLEHKPDKLQQCLQYIEAHYAEPLSNPDLARRCRMSERSFMNMFQQYQGVSPGQHIRKVRMRAASDLILRTQNSLEEIAQAVGLGTQAYLTRVFTQTTGQSPARFRRAHGNG